MWTARGSKVTKVSCNENISVQVKCKQPKGLKNFKFFKPVDEYRVLLKVEFSWKYGFNEISGFLFKCLRIANFIKKSNENFYWTSSRISIGCPLKSTGLPVELLYRTSCRAEDLAY